MVKVVIGFKYITLNNMGFRSKEDRGDNNCDPGNLSIPGKKGQPESNLS